MFYKSRILSIADYEPFIGAQAVERIIKKAAPLQGRTVANVNATYYGGGVAEMLESIVLTMNSLGIQTEWRTITGSPEFFNITKGMHNGLQSANFKLDSKTKEIYEGTIHENFVRNSLTHDFVVIHDPQPLPIIKYYNRRSPWIWRCHIDMSNPNKGLWNYLKDFVNMYDASIFSIKEFQQKLKIPQAFFMPTINPFSLKNRELSEKVMSDTLNAYKIPTDLPLVVQISRYDRWKDPEGVIKAFKMARRKVGCTLVLLGNMASDDPEGQHVLESLKSHEEDRILILSGDDVTLVNTLQKKAAVVLQKSIKEGFGLTVTEAMWKGTPVIGGNVGGIRYQIKDGVNGYLVSSVEDAADRIVRVLKDKDLRKKMGKSAREHVRKNFLMTRLVEQYIDLFNAFGQPKYSLDYIPK